MWANADKAEIRQHPDVSNGWDLVDGYYLPIWHEGPQMPDSLVPEKDELATNDNENDEDMGMGVSSDAESDWTEDDVL